MLELLAAELLLAALLEDVALLEVCSELEDTELLAALEALLDELLED